MAELEAAYDTGAGLSPMQRSRIRDVAMAEFLQGCLEGWLASRYKLTVIRKDKSTGHGAHHPSPVLAEWRALVRQKAALIDSMGLDYPERKAKSLDDYVIQAAQDAEAALEALRAPSTPDPSSGDANATGRPGSVGAQSGNGEPESGSDALDF